MFGGNNLELSGKKKRHLAELGLVVRGVSCAAASSQGEREENGRALALMVRYLSAKSCRDGVCCRLLGNVVVIRSRVSFCIGLCAGGR